MQGALADNLGAEQKIQVCRSSQSTRLTQISALGLLLSERHPLAHQLPFCTAKHYPWAEWKKSSPFHL